MLEKIPHALGAALHGVRPGIAATLWGDETLAALPTTLTLTSTAFADDGPLPARVTADGPGISPPLAWIGIPPGTAELVIVVEDADPPLPKPLVHLIVHGIRPDASGIAEGALSGDLPLLSCGLNSYLKTGWLPPDPPSGHGDHRYLFQLYALNKTAALGERPGRHAVADALHGAAIARGLLTGRYARA